ncbi:cytochrome P460 family protein [Citreimonas salinaria]|uniref:Cytochrome P460 n=1 Tax=Citreimonas salinaria TaxID=321339 RepID=A0A1H3LK99_9RHOB|nr:cytochrome P460 family protein [Citreimonas salinaria]SDY64872.1 Cytochrome P460 [Citreimonas salinaria]
MRWKKTVLAGACAARATSAALPLIAHEDGMSGSVSVDASAFGSAGDVRFARNLWQALSDAGIVGDDAIQTHPYAGSSKHGPVVQYIDGTVTVGDYSGTFITKRNYRGEDISVEEIFADPSSHFDSLGVMFRREEGYAPDSADWFWAKFMPDGTVATTPDGMSMAGQVAPCISCHQPADGEDFVWGHDRFSR